uniref:Inhibitor of Bruton tyrosine kinase n=1 Tax=Leptobrachium leishanense TaxID=445787 RepID=A0A8C5PWA2_9ANUR
MDLVWPECTTRCRSLQHALEVVSVLTRGSEQQIKAFLSSYCCNASTLKDGFGRTAAHIAASCGKKGVLDWLATAKGVDLSVKDKESGWTALHRSIFYGHIDCALSLLQHGSNPHIQDKDGYTALDMIMKDRPPHVVFKTSDPTELYTWGNNINFTLGHGSQQSKYHPELIDMFPRSGIYIKQVVLCKFHSVFLSQKGQVYTCGHGQGGRLGHGDELTCLFPRMVDGLAAHPCSQVAAAKDHTVVLTEDGYVYTFGLNTFHQLGILPPPTSCNVPRQVQAKTLKGKNIIGVAAGRFHTVLWSKDAVYTMGLNGGQLGYLLDPNGEKYVSNPRQVSALHHKDVCISLVSVSDGASVCVTEKGDVYLLCEYQCKKLASKQLNLKKILVSGGLLEYKVDTQLLKENGGQPISILALDQAGRVFCMKYPSGSMRQCRWVYGRQVFMSDISLNKNEIMFVTQEGEGFTGKWMHEKKKNIEKKESSVSDSSLHCDAHSVYERISLQKLSFVHRAVSINTDPNGCNFAVLQSDPKISLFEIPVVSSSVFAEDFEKLLNEVHETDSIHDVSFQLDSRIFPAHKYILAVRCDLFSKLFFSWDDHQHDFPDIYKKGEDAAGCDLFVLEKVHPDLFPYILQFVYTDKCDMLIQGHKPRLRHKEKIEEAKETFISDFQKMNFHEDIKGKSAFEVYRNNQICGSNDKQKGKTKSCKKSKYNNEETSSSPVKMLQNIAKKFGLSNLTSRLDGVKYENGEIKVVHRKSGNRTRFSQKKCPTLRDVTMRSEDRKEFHCHKCVLCARLEYFHSMLSSSWIEATCCTALEMPVQSDVLQVIIDYIYTDEALAVKESANVEFICNVLVMADQLLIIRLKEICEVIITERITLKNAAELLEFAALYNAEQLKLSCFQFIVLNMAALLEARTLDVLSDDVLKELSDAYRKTIIGMDRRMITPYLDGPDISMLECEEGDHLLSIRDDVFSEQATQDSVFKKAKAKAKKKPRKRSDSSGGYNLSDIIQSPPSTGFFKSEKANSAESLQELLTSDSEGSFVGASSPRELRSPDLSTICTSDKNEVKSKHDAFNTSTSSHVGNSTASVKIAAPKVSSPEAIPSTKVSPKWISGAFSPASPPAMDLRTIMEIEENIQKGGATPKIAAGGSKPVLHGMKLSQKQRKMMAMSPKDISSNTENSPAKANSPSTKTTGKIWAPSSHSGEQKAFRDLLVEQKSVISFHPLSSSGKKNVQTEELDAQTFASPWVSISSNNTTSAVPVTFTAIVEEEKKQEAALVRSREKPLALIQVLLLLLTLRSEQYKTY